MSDTFDPVAYINEPRWMESRLGLDRIRELLERLDRPQDAFKAVHVAGTNGKGSTCVLTASVLQAAGYRTGLFTSPYILEFSDRIKVDNANISADDLRDVTLAVKREAEAMKDHPTEFELMTAVAFLHFARQACDIAVIEVGLGGRLDSTNVLESPEVCVIASIALDHTAWLGTTIGEIAREKAGIIKPHVPVVSWPQAPEAMEVVSGVVADQGALLTVPDFSTLERVSHDRLVRRFSYKAYDNLETHLMGSYQPYNAALAIEAIEVLRGRGWIVPDEALRAGIADARWPGRFEIVAQNPTFIIDGGHNPQGARVLADSLHDVFPGKKVVLIMGVLEDKDYPAMLEAMLPLGSAFITITPPTPRALSAAKLASAIRWTGQDVLGCSARMNPYVASDIPDAIAKARELAGADGLICAFGSLYSVAAIKAAL